VKKHDAILNDQQWHMPAMNFFATPLPGVNLEVVSLDMNILDAHKICPWIACGCHTCPCPPDDDVVEDEAHATTTRRLDGRYMLERKLDWLGRCSYGQCQETLRQRADAGFMMLKERIAAAEVENRQLIVITHYPTKWFRYSSWKVNGQTILDLMKNPRVHIAYFGGHVHGKPGANQSLFLELLPPLTPALVLVM